MPLKSAIIRDSNIFNLETPRKKILVFITQGGHLSGKIMKGIDFRLPAVITKMKEELANDNSIGRVFEIRDIIFVVYKKHYNTKLTTAQFDKFLEKIAQQLNQNNLKITNEDWPNYKDVIIKYIPTIEYRESSEWPYT